MFAAFIIVAFFVLSVAIKRHSTRMTCEKKNASVDAWWSRLKGELDVSEEGILFRRQYPVKDRYWNALPNKFTAKDWEPKLREFSHLVKVFIEDTYIVPGKARQRRAFYELWFLSMSYFTRVLSEYGGRYDAKLSLGKLCKLMGVCFWLATKVTGLNVQFAAGYLNEMLNDMEAPEPLDGDGIKPLVDIERFVLQTLEWKLHDSTVYTFVERLQLPDETQWEILQKAMDIRLDTKHPDHTKTSFVVVQRIVNKMV